MPDTIIAEYQPYLFLLFGSISVVVTVLWKSKSSQLKQTGIPVDGIIFEQDVDNSARSSIDNSSNVKDIITVRFVTKNQEWITGVISQDFEVFYTGQYKNGDAVKVFYDKDNPSNFYVDTNQSELQGRLVFGLVGLVFTGIGLYQLLA